MEHGREQPPIRLRMGQTGGREVSEFADDVTDALCAAVAMVAKDGPIPMYAHVPGADLVNGEWQIYDAERFEKWRTAVTGEK